MRLRKILQIVSFGLLFYLLADSFMHFGFAASKNNAFTSMQKMEVDSNQNIHFIKQKAKDYLETIRSVHRKYSDKSVISFWLLSGVIVIQVFLLLNKQPKSAAENNGR